MKHRRYWAIRAVAERPDRKGKRPAARDISERRRTSGIRVPGRRSTDIQEGVEGIGRVEFAWMRSRPAPHSTSCRKERSPRRTSRRRRTKTAFWSREALAASVITEGTGEKAHPDGRAR